MKKKLVAAAAAAMVIALPACQGGGASPNQNTGTSGDGTVAQLLLPSDADAAVGGLINYNVHSPKPLTSVWLYEPLMIQNTLSCEVTPWLATEFVWEGEGASKLVLTIRDGVKWSDGQPMTAKDVAFTFNLAKEYPAIDKSGVWNANFGSPARSVTAEGNKVTFEFGGNAAPKFAAVISTKILPEHVYSKVGDPSKYVDKEPVGTGPYKVGSYNGRRLELVRRDDYWQADKIKVQKLILEGSFDASQAALKLRAGQLDMYAGEIPNPKKTFADADPEKNHFFYAPAGMTVLTPNLTKPPFDDPKFREAVSYAINKDEISLKATYGIMKPASQSGLKLPSMQKMLPEQYANNSVLPFDSAKAEELLEAAGYKKGADGKRTMPDGSPIDIDFSIQSGWIDYQATADVIVAGLNSIGLTAKTTASAPNSVDSMKKSGDFQLMLEYLHGGCEFAQGIGAKLTSKQFPTSKDVYSNVGRFKDPAVDKTVSDLSASVDPAVQKKLVGELVTVMMTQYPVTTLVYAPSRLFYRTDHAVGWPSEEDPYASNDDRLLIMTRLRAPK